MIYWPYVALTVIILGPLLLPGFVLTMDMVFTPTLRLPDHVDNTYLFYAFLHVLNFVLPADFIQKVMLVAILLLSGVGAHRMLVRLIPKVGAAAYAGGLFFMLNPFVYDRFMVGQYGVLLGYALLPLFLISLCAFLEAPDWRRMLRLSVWAILASIVSIHSLGLLFILTIIGVVLKVRSRTQLKQIAVWGAAAAGVWAVASSYWLVPVLLGQGRIAASLTTFGAAERQAFATVDLNGLGKIGSVLGLQGFWQDPRQLYILPNNFAPWALVQLAMWGLLVVGFVRAWKVQRITTIYFVAIGAMAAVLAVGVGSDWLAAHVPFFAGYREPQKFAALVVLAYVFAFTHAAIWLQQRLKRVAVISMGVLTMLYTPTMLWGFTGQLHATQYPQGWYAANEQLNHESGQGSALFLPWHLYMSYDFAERIIASPAPAFFDRAIIASDDPELDGASPQTHNVTREAIQERVLPEASTGKPIGAELRQLGIGYIIVAKQYDFVEYNFLAQQQDLLLIRDTKDIRLYKVK
jgi:hypothetical protein